MGYQSLQVCKGNCKETNYEPVINISPELNPDQAYYFQPLIGIMHQMVEFCHIDIAKQVSLLSLHLALPQEGHMDAALHVMAYVGLHHDSCLLWIQLIQTLMMTSSQK